MGRAGRVLRWMVGSEALVGPLRMGSIREGVPLVRLLLVWLLVVGVLCSGSEGRGVRLGDIG